MITQVVPVKSPSRKDILEGVKRTLSHFRVVATGSGCALVQLQPLTGGSQVGLEPQPDFRTVFGWGGGGGGGEEDGGVRSSLGAFEGPPECM